MADRLPPGPYRVIPTADGQGIPWYIVPFDREGRCTGPLTADHLVEALRSGRFTDVYLFSHGWNNAWKEASERYEHFIDGYREMREQPGFEIGREYRPLLVGVFWPSAVLVMPWERGPQFAAAVGASDQAVGEERADVEEIARELPDADVRRFYELSQIEGDLGPDQAEELARILSAVYAEGDDELPHDPAGLDPAELLEVWKAIPPVEPRSAAAGDDGHGVMDDTGEEVEAAGRIGWKARDLVRATTVYMMKDRAGRVGSVGVSPLLARMIEAAPDARVHAIGHSYGCKVVLSAICARELPGDVDSALLLQPAVNHLCFAENAGGTGRPGGYRSALGRVRQPILSTFSARDSALHKFFHTFVRRASDLGEVRIAGAPPSEYAALGGYGAGGCASGECLEMPMKDVGEPYDLDVTSEVLSLDGTKLIAGHGDISNPATWWALYSQVRAG